jgi:hypothetical protein
METGSALLMGMQSAPQHECMWVAGCLGGTAFKCTHTSSEKDQGCITELYKNKVLGGWEVT